MKIKEEKCKNILHEINKSLTKYLNNTDFKGDYLRVEMREINTHDITQGIFFFVGDFDPFDDEE